MEGWKGVRIRDGNNEKERERREIRKEWQYVREGVRRKGGFIKEGECEMGGVRKG